ncbi:MAG: FixH family protein [Phycisphaerales bacterium]|jgi:nitrogen fixation protein FixH
MKPGIGWPVAIVSLLGMNMVIVGITVFYANTSKTSGVVPDYYTKAVHWEDTQRQQSVNRALGWSAAWEGTAADRLKPGSLVLTLKDGAGKAIRAASVQFEAFHEADDTKRASGVMSMRAEGVYEAIVPLTKAGRWHVHAVVDSLGTRFTCETVVEAMPHSGAAGRAESGRAE